MYINNARVSIEGTNLEAFTDQSGSYLLENVPAGPVSIRVTYLGQTPQVASVTVEGGVQAVQDITFNEDQAVRTEDGTLILSEFTVASTRFRDAQEIAVNEQRNSVNIKNVISVDQFGDIPSGNVGELVKFMPGVQLDYGSFGGNNQGYSDNDASGISVRGFGPADTQILIDGMPVSNATPGNLTRQVALDQLSINNASRVELIKVPTPDMPANSIGGQVNLITKSAFEQVRPTYQGRVFFNINSLNASLKKTPGPVKEARYKTAPGFEATITVPVTKNFGVSFTGSAVNDANQSYRAESTWAYTGNAAITNANGPISLSNPILNRYRLTNTASYVERRSGNLRLDWKPTPSQTIRANVQYSTYTSEEAQRRMDFRPTIAVGADWGPTFTRGTTANSTVDMTVSTRDKEGKTESAQLQYKLKKSGWVVDLAGSTSKSESDYQDRKNGHFSEIALKLNPGQVIFNNIKDGGIVTDITTMNRVANGGGERDFSTLSNFGFDGTLAKSGESSTEVVKQLVKADIERDLNFLPFLGNNSMTLKVGGRYDSEKNEKSGRGINYREILRPGASYVVGDILDTYYLDQELGFGLPSQQWGSTYKLYELNQEMDLFYEPPGPESTNTQTENYVSWVNQQKSITEERTGFYGMLSGRFFSNRLTFVGGVRQENSTRKGYAPFTDSRWEFLKRPDGTIWTNETYRNGIQLTQGNGTVDADGNFLAMPTNRPVYTDAALRAQLAAEGYNISATRPLPPNSHLSSRKLQLQPMRYTYAKVTGDPSYSFNIAYKLTEKIDLKAAWSRTFGMPRLEDGATGLISGNNTFTVNDFDVDQIANNYGYLGSISIANPNLLPETSDNLDFAVSYYTDSGGQFTVNYWRKDVTNQSMTFRIDRNAPGFQEILEGAGFSMETYGNYYLSTSTNATDVQKTSGWEFEVRHDFGFLGRLGRNFAAFASYAFTDLGDPPAVVPVSVTGPNGTPYNVTPSISTLKQRANRFGGAGLQYSGARLNAQIRGVYRNDNEVAQSIIPDTGNVVRRFEPEETRIDVSVSYMLTKNFSWFLSGRDIFNSERKLIVRDDFGEYPSHAERYDTREFGVVWSTGITAKF